MGHRGVDTDDQIQLGHNPRGGRKARKRESRLKQIKAERLMAGRLRTELKINQLGPALAQLLHQAPDDAFREGALLEFTLAEGIAQRAASRGHQTHPHPSQAWEQAGYCGLRLGPT